MDDIRWRTGRRSGCGTCSKSDSEVEILFSIFRQTLVNLITIVRRIILTGSISVFFVACGHRQAQNQKKSNVDSSFQIKADTVTNYGKSESNPLFAFVGQKIELGTFPEKRRSMDQRFKAKYKILQTIYGHFAFDTIEFIVYDHYGIPEFSKYKNVLLFVSEDSGVYYHQKYLFYDVYKTKNGRWAGSYSQKDYDRKSNTFSNTRPIKIDFAEEVIYPTKILWVTGSIVTRSYPSPYFKTIGDSARAIYGNYVEDLFKLERDGVLTARQIFKNGKLR